MKTSSPLSTLRSRIKSLQKTVKMVCLAVFRFLLILSIFCGILLYLCAALWIGEPSEVTCQDVNFIRIDCTLKYQALLRASEQKIIDVQRLDIEQHVSSSESGSTTKYIAVLRTRNGKHPIKTYPNRNNSELEVLIHRLNKFFKAPKEKLTVQIQHNPWKRIITQFGLLFIPLAFYLGISFAIVVVFTIIYYAAILCVLCIYRTLLFPLFLMRLLRSFWRFGVLKAKNFKFAIFKVHCAFTQLWHSEQYQRGHRFIMAQLRHAPRLSHTQFLLFGLAIGYVVFVWWIGIRLIVLVSGAVIVGLAIVSWYTQSHSQPTIPAPSSANLLQTDIFLNHLSSLDHHVPDTSQSLWQAVQQQAQAIQQIAIQISQRESTLVPDLLETLHTVLDLVDQLVQALQVIQQVLTPHYQELAQQQLQSSQTRLQLTHDQFQELHDQMALEHLKQRSLTTDSVISTRLQTLIVENERGILGD